MSGQWEKYVDDATRAFCVARWGEGLTDQADPDDIEFYRQGVAAAVAAVGPLIAEDTRDRLVAAAGRAVERDSREPACAYPHLVHGDGRGCETDDCPRHPYVGEEGTG